jgi:Domain of unknown function (DUF4276)
MQLEVLVEEPSMATALDILIPRIVPDHSFCVYQHQGKMDLLGNLKARLRSYAGMQSHWPELRVVVVVDRDSEDCHDLKQKLVDACVAAKCDALCRIAIEELEAWFFGDIDALRVAYPAVSPNLANKAPYRDPDAITGGTWEALERVLQRAGHYPTGMPKVEVARRIAQHMSPEANRSKSFQIFRDGLRSIVAQSEKTQKCPAGATE